MMEMTLPPENNCINLEISYTNRHTNFTTPELTARESNDFCFIVIEYPKNSAIKGATARDEGIFFK